MMNRATLSLSAPRPLLLALAATLALLSPLGAQERPERVDLAGRVVDAASGAPIGRAVITLKGGHGTVATDAEGRFVVPRLRPGSYLVTVERLGYLGVAQAVRVSPSTGPAEFRLQGEPLMLERISVNADRLQARRNAAPVSVRTLKAEELAGSPYPDVEQLVTGRLVSPMTCTLGFGSCIYVRGQAQPISIFVDEVPAFGGLNQLSMYDPQEVFLIESYSQGRMIRVYTNEYMDRLARRNRSPDPVIW